MAETVPLTPRLGRKREINRKTNKQANKPVVCLREYFLIVLKDDAFFR